MESLPSVASAIEKLRARGIEVPSGPVGIDSYGDSPELSASLIALIRAGPKRAGTGLLWAYEAENEPLPTIGQIEIVVDHRNEPVLITRITRVEVLPYASVTAEYAAIEGEGDGSLEYWREAHWAFFSRECQRLGREASESMPVVCSVFELLGVVPDDPIGDSHPANTGAQLRSLYQSEGGVGEIFSAKVFDYARSRPDYPVALYEMLRHQCPPRPGVVVADIGAGTGLLTKGLLLQGYDVVAVEPNAAMRSAADRSLAEFPGYRSVAGTAEAIPLGSSSVDLITAAQAFHWFEVDRARTECLRVLRPQGQVALIWNDRVSADPLHVALDELFARYGGARRAALVAHEDRGNLQDFFGSTVPTEFAWPHAHYLDDVGFESLVFSRSYMPEQDSPAGPEASQHVRKIFRQFAQEGRVTVRYTTVVAIGRPR